MIARARLKKPGLNDHRLVIRGLVLTGLFCLTQPSSARAKVSQAGIAWEAGWNLLALPGSDRNLDSLSGVQVWTAPPATADAYVRAPGGFPTGVGGTGFVWLHASQRGSISVKTTASSTGTENQALDHDLNILTVKEPKSYDGVHFPHVQTWDPTRGRYERLSAGDTMLPGRVYFVGQTQSDSPEKALTTDAVSTRSPRPPSTLRSTSHRETVSLSWRAPRLWSDGTRIPPDVALSYVLYRNGTLVAEGLVKTTTQDEVPDVGMIYSYYVKAEAKEPGGQVFRSKPSDAIAHFVGDPRAPPEPGAFEQPIPVSARKQRAYLPRVHIAEGPKGPVTHLVYLTRGAPGKSDRVLYQKSHRFGAPGGWSKEPVIVAEPGADINVLELAIATYQDQVDIA